MLGSALETILILMVNIYADEAEQTGKAPMKKGQPKPLLDWQFVELLRVAKAANWPPGNRPVVTPRFWLITSVPSVLPVS